MPFTYDYPRPSVTVDCVLFSMREEDLAVLLVRRKNAPFRGAWALPGGFVNENEPLEAAAARELAEETGIFGVPLEQFGAFGAPERDPRGHTVSVAFHSFLVAATPPVAADDASDAGWVPLRTLAFNQTARAKPARAIKLAFDHAQIIESARRRLQERLADPGRDSPFAIVPPCFTLPELQRVYEAVLGRKVSTRPFRTRLIEASIVELVSQGRGAKTRSARGTTPLYRFKPSRRG